MQNPILQAMQSTVNPTMLNNGPAQMIQQFAEFKKQMQGKNPQAIVQELLNSGRMSQAQFEQLKQQAQSLQNILK
nr:MAG TPA: Short C-terminal domain [Caudoviricetes sp.]